MTSLILRVRGRLALTLARPFIDAQEDRARRYFEAGHQGGSWGPGLWMGKVSAMVYLRSDLASGHLATAGIEPEETPT